MISTALKQITSSPKGITFYSQQWRANPKTLLSEPHRILNKKMNTGQLFPIPILSLNKKMNTQQLFPIQICCAELNRKDDWSWI